MDDQLNRIYEVLTELRGKQDTLQQTQAQMQLTQVEQKVILEDHVRRSIANEQGVSKLTELILTVRDGFAGQLAILKAGFEHQLRPIQKHVDRVQFLFTMIVGAGAIAGAIYTVLEAIKGVLK